MKVAAEPMENSQVSLNVEMEAVEVDKYIERAYNRLVCKVSVPGFRKGKTPRDILERHIGKDVLLREALEDLIPEACVEALESQKIDAIARPQIEIIQTEPVVFKAIVPLRPTVNLGDYKVIRLDSNPVEIGEEDVDAAIEQLRDQHATLLPVDRPVQFGDTATIDVKGKNEEGESFTIREGLVYEVFAESRLPLPGFAEKLEGMTKGEERSFVLFYPPDYEMEELAGKEHYFEVKLAEVKEKKLPEVDDEFARTLGSEDSTLLREQITTNLKTIAGERARLELEQRAIDAVIGISEIEYPQVLVDKGIDRLLDEETRYFTDGRTGLENYLKNVNKTMEDHCEELRPQAIQRVIRSVVLEKIAEVEEIEVNDSEIDDEIERMVKDAEEEAEGMRKLFNLPQARESIKQSLVGQKTMERLVQVTTGSV